MPFANLAVLYRDSGRLKIALEAADEAIGREPNHPDHHALKATLLVQVRDFSGARESALKSLELDPRHHEGHLALGESLGRLDAFDDADSVLAAGLAFHPDSDELQRMRRKLQNLAQSAPGR
jgi:tetratricopeptide (TPR) repeat protein